MCFYDLQNKIKLLLLLLLLQQLLLLLLLLLLQLPSWNESNAQQTTNKKAKGS